MDEKIITRTLNEKQFAKTVGLSYAKVKQLRQRGDIKCLRVGRRVLYRFPEHIELFLNRFEEVG